MDRLLHPRLLLDPDLKAETVAGVTFRRLAGAGTVPFDTLWGNSSDNCFNGFMIHSDSFEQWFNYFVCFIVGFLFVVRKTIHSASY